MGKAIACQKQKLIKKCFTVKCVWIGASESLYSPVTRISLWTSSLRHFLLPADNVNDRPFAWNTSEKQKVTRPRTVAIFVVNLCSASMNVALQKAKTLFTIYQTYTKSSENHEAKIFLSKRTAKNVRFAFSTNTVNVFTIEVKIAK